MKKINEFLDNYKPGNLSYSDGSKTRLDNGSADNQIDSFILLHEASAIKSVKISENVHKVIGEALKDFKLDALLEVEDLAEKPKGEPVDSSMSDVKKPIKDEPVPAIDIDKFAKNIKRLIFNYDNLLDIRAVILNRAVVFLLDKYTKDHAQEFLDTNYFNYGDSYGRVVDELREMLGDPPRQPGATGGGGG